MFVYLFVYVHNLSVPLLAPLSNPVAIAKALTDFTDLYNLNLVQLGFGDSVLGSSQGLPLPQLSQNMMLNSKWPK